MANHQKQLKFAGFMFAFYSHN